MGGKLNINSYQEPGDTIITVQDTGAGIPETVKPKRFTPLFKTKSKDQGLELAIVKRMTEALNGTVTFESEEGKGIKKSAKVVNDVGKGIKKEPKKKD
jgi:signal transduction histidine kinase